MTVTIAVGPLAFLWVRTSVDPLAPATGAAAWVVVVGVKRIVNPLLRRALTKGCVYAAVSGIWSALCELGIAAACFAYLLKELSIASTLAFGFGAATAEIAVLLSLSGIRSARLPDPKRLDAWRVAAQRSVVIRYLMPLERSTASALHVGCRGLVYLAVCRASYGLFIVGFVGFALVDGVASFGRNASWNWFDPPTAGRFFGFVAPIAALEIIVYALESRRI